VGDQRASQPAYGELPTDGAVAGPNRMSELPAEHGRSEVYNAQMQSLGENGYGGQNGYPQNGYPPNDYAQNEYHQSPQSNPGYGQSPHQSLQSGHGLSPQIGYEHDGYNQHSPVPLDGAGTMGGHGDYADGFPGNDLGIISGHYGSGGYSGGEYTGQHLEPIAGNARGEHDSISPVSSSTRSPGMQYHELPTADREATQSYQQIERKPINS